MKKVFLFLGLMLCATVLQAKRIYLNANIWDVDSPDFYVHAWGGGDADVKLAKVSGTVYSGEVPDGTTSVLFLRMKPAESFDWGNEWNRTSDLDIPAGMDCYTIEGWSYGGWSKYDGGSSGGGDEPGCEEFGLLIDGVYRACAKNPDPADKSFIEYYVENLPLTAGQSVQVHDKCYENTWIITKYADTSYEFAIEDNKYKVTETGSYTIYMKFKTGNDEIWISCPECKEAPVTSGSVPRQCEDVMIQAFYNESYWPDSAELGTNICGDTRWATLLPQVEEMAQSFDLIWLPPSAYGAGMGYHPKNYSDQNSNWGTREELEELISAIHAEGSKVIADIVINHCEGWTSWCDFPEMDFGKFGVFHPDASYICSNDEVNTSDKAKESAGECYGAATGNLDDGQNWDGARDWSHDNVYVQEMFIAYLKWMREEMKYDGFRYDKGDGFNNWHHWNYNDKSKPYIAFMECYTGNDEIISRIKDAKYDMMALDFQTRWSAIWENGNGGKPDTGIGSFNYAACKGSGMLGAGYAKHAITFIDSHDWFMRKDAWSQEFGGYGKSLTPEVKDRLLQANAYILGMPGVPCVFYPHWAVYKEEIKKMIEARKLAGVHSESPVSDEYADNDGYQCTLKGKHGWLVLQLGNRTNHEGWGDPDYKLIAQGNGYAMWVNRIDSVEPEPEPVVPENLRPNPDYRNSAPENCTDVMLQAFYWDSNEMETMPGSTTEIYGSTEFGKFLNRKNPVTKENLATEMGKWFDLIWLPPFSRSTGGTGYLPIQYSDLNSDWSTAANVKKLIKRLHTNGARVIEDIVINHVSGEPTWCTFAKQDFGEYGEYKPTATWICRTDDMNWSEDAKDPETGAGDCFGKAAGNNDEGYDGLDDFNGGRDWDHKNVKVQNMCKAYLKWLVNEIHIDGFRYDYCKGFKNGYIADYNSVASPYFSVMEMWDGRVDDLRYHLEEARRTSTTFDFATKFSAFNYGVAYDNYSALKGSGLLGAGESRYAVTFIDNHDTFMRNEKGQNDEFLGVGNSMANDANKAKVLQCNAFILSMPGVPCVFYPHWITFTNQIKAMIDARYMTGVHSQSSVSDEAGDGFYKATIYGTNGEIRLLLGPNSGYNSTPAGYTLADKGVNYGVYYKTISPRNSKATERTPVPEAIEDIHDGQNTVKAEKFIHNGQLYIRVGEKVYDLMGRNVQ